VKALAAPAVMAASQISMPCAGFAAISTTSGLKPARSTEPQAKAQGDLACVGMPGTSKVAT